MKPVSLYLAAAVLGVGLGFGSAWMVLSNGKLLGQFEHDHWFGNEDAGSSAADPYTRGIIAKIGLLALNRSETIYFHRYVDDHDEPLREQCVYELSGAALPTRWWSITVYAGDDFLPVNGDAAFSVDASQIQTQSQGQWTTRLAADRAGAANWISTRNAGKFNLALRMYNPDAGARDDASSIPYPKIRRISCGEAVS